MKVKLRKQLGWWLLGVTGAALLAGASQPLPYVILKPGPTFNVLGKFEGQELISVSPAVDDNPVGSIDLLTVSEEGSPGNTPYLWELIPVLFSKDQAIYPIDLVYPDDKTFDELESEALNSFEQSKTDAISAAGTALPTGALEKHRIDLELADVGGPSGGLAFTLGIIDKLTEGSLTGGKKLAVTGTIDKYGKVGPIGGIRQKVFSAARADDRFMLIPVDNCEDLTQFHLKQIRVVPVNNLKEALRYITLIADDRDLKGLPACSAK